MLVESTEDEGFYGGRYLPQQLAVRAARVTDDPLQLSLSCFRSAEARSLCVDARRDLLKIRLRESVAIARRDKGVLRFDP